MILLGRLREEAGETITDGPESLGDQEAGAPRVAIRCLPGESKTSPPRAKLSREVRLWPTASNGQLCAI